jgi:hypothetical protein
MAENYLINHPASRRARSNELSSPIDRERAHRARQAAEALFAPKPKPRVAEPGASRSLAAIEKQERTPPPAAPGPNVPAAVEPGAADNAKQSEPQIPAAHAGRIRTWLRYGMSMAEVAAVYGVGVGEVERILHPA